MAIVGYGWDISLDVYDTDKRCGVGYGGSVEIGRAIGDDNGVQDEVIVSVQWKIASPRWILRESGLIEGLGIMRKKDLCVKIISI